LSGAIIAARTVAARTVAARTAVTARIARTVAPNVAVAAISPISVAILPLRLEAPSTAGSWPSCWGNRCVSAGAVAL